ncbi:MAG: non-ribosomal peptide synthetase, partial [Chloroflexi bacterium]|nr:non-ribosomal peptide synthetase [Chloroflexota bacterium]
MSDLSTRIASLSPQQRELLARRLAKQQAPRPQAQIQPAPRATEPLPLSFAQQRLWFLEQMAPGSPAYTMAGAARITGILDAAALQQSLDAVAQRHEVLRSTFQAQAGQPVLRLGAAQPVPLRVVDLRGVEASEREAEEQRLMTRDARLPFDLTNGPLLRATLIRPADEEHLLLVAMHHIVADGWSTKVLFRDMGALYAAFTAGRPSPLPPLPVQYADFAYWQRKRLGDDVLAPHLAYWKERLCGPLPVLELPADRPRPATQTFNGAQRPFELPAELAEALRDLSRREGVTLFMTLLAAFKCLLHRYTGQEDVLVGTPIANRGPETEGLVGLFVNTLVLRDDLSGDPRFRELVQQVRSTALEAYAHQDVPFEKLVEEIHPERDLSHSPIFQVLFNLQSDPMAQQPQAGTRLTGLTLEDVDTGAAKFDVTINLVERRDGLGGHIEYNTDLFDVATIDRLASHFRTVLASVAADPDRKLSELTLLDDVERRRLLVEWNDTSRDFPRDRCVHQLVAAQAAQSPDAVAVVCGDRSLTYAELDRRSNQV